LGGVVKWPLTKRLPKGLSRFMLPFFQKEKEASLLENLFISWDL
jgi:hypothetical protein